MSIQLVLILLGKTGDAWIRIDVGFELVCQYMWWTILFYKNNIYR